MRLVLVGLPMHAGAEFCPSSHLFNISPNPNKNIERNVTFGTAGTAWGCTHAVRYGSVPNEHGTWMYGRDGWCDGMAVAPWMSDISDIVAKPGRTTSFLYRALFNGTDPDPAAGASPGYIMMNSFVAYFGPRSPRATSDMH